jgi:hypothetical protein
MAPATTARMKSFRSIESSLSETEQEFMRFVERQAGGHDALYQAELNAGLPGDTVRVQVSADAGADVSALRHTVEFMSLSGDGHWQPAGCIGHVLREIETMQGRHVEIESSFVVAGPGAREGKFALAEVESVVQDQLARLKAARLLPLGYSS